MDDDSSQEEGGGGSPAWMATFSDLMSLLMCFFVLLLSFSEMDVLKFKQIAGSMKFAFGVQNRLEVKDIPKGTSVIAQEFRPGRPEPTPIEVIMQQTTDMTKRSLNFQEGETSKAGGQKKETSSLVGGSTAAEASQTQDANEQSQQSQAQAQSQAEAAEQATTELQKKLEEVLAREIVDGSVDVENLGQELLIRIRENGVFPADSAFLQPKFRPLMRQIASFVKDIPGIVRVTGHTDSSANNSELYRSNWDLSAQRAVSIAQEFERVKGFERNRMEVVGKAGTEPLASNDTVAGRAKNRRVEINIIQGKPHKSDPVSIDKNKK